MISPIRRHSIQYFEFVVEGKPMESWTYILDDSTDISRRRGEFVGLVNNVTCYFQKQCSAVKYRLFQAYCSVASMVASYEMCRVISWLIIALLGESIRRVWNVPPDTHGYILPTLCKCSPVYDEICRRSANFLRARILHNSILVRTVGLYGIMHGQCDSPNGRNALLCMRRYGVTQSELLSARRIEKFIWGHSMELITAEQERSADFLQECIKLRDNVFSLPSYYTRTDIELIIQHLCRSD